MNDTPEPHDPHRQHEPARARAARLRRSAGRDAVRLQLQSAGDDAGSEPGAARAASARTSSRSSSSRCSPTPRATPTSSCRPRRSSSTTTSPRRYGPISLQLVRPVIEPVGEARPNPEVFSDLAERLGVGERGRGNRDAAADRRPAAASRSAPSCWSSGVVDAAVRRRADPVRRRVSADAGRQGRTSSRRRSTPRRPAGSTAISRIRRPTRYPLALISPASEKTISSTLGELRERAGDAADAPRRRRGARARRTDDPVRVFNDLGEVHCPVAVNAGHPPGHGRAAERAVAEEHLQRLDGERARARHADRPRRRRLLQRRARPGRVCSGGTEQSSFIGSQCRLQAIRAQSTRSARGSGSLTELRAADQRSTCLSN